MKAVVCLIGMTLFLVGCGTSSDKVDVTGRVTWNGEPLEKGTISFLEPDKSSDAAVVTNGEFSAKVTPGKKHVGVVSFKDIAVPGGRSTDEVINYQFLPLEYNQNSTLTADIESSGKSLTFDLTGKELPGPKGVEADNRRPNQNDNSGRR